jgi:hypothetical protein
MSCYSRQKAKFFKNVKQRFDKGANKRSWKVGIKEYVGIEVSNGIGIRPSNQVDPLSFLILDLDRSTRDRGTNLRPRFLLLCAGHVQLEQRERARAAQHGDHLPE